MAIDSAKFKGKFFFDVLLNNHLKKNVTKITFLNSKRLLLFYTFILKEYDLLQIKQTT